MDILGALKNTRKQSLGTVRLPLYCLGSDQSCQAMARLDQLWQDTRHLRNVRGSGLCSGPNMPVMRTALRRIRKLEIINRKRGWGA